MDDQTKIYDAIDRMGPGVTSLISRSGIELTDAETSAKFRISWGVVGQVQTWLDAASFFEANR
ncbi:hypothetical protein V3I01_08100 [Sphingomonas sp. gentR]|uniref:hypothetical protein n=1 Tax=unclassified Sphingomonas TaxID=196159 RepID=UPI000972D381|nr:hypothetical protein [Sphingomonas sp. LK11]APX66285.1 hypothetical protein AV944_11095 [Sphingomonas sp. LK11]